MKKIFAILLLSVLSAESVLAVRTIPFYDLKRSTINAEGGTQLCAYFFDAFCWHGVVNVAEEGDISALEQRIMSKMQSSIENTKIDLVNAQNETAKALIDSDELKEAMRALIREELRKAK